MSSYEHTTIIGNIGSVEPKTARSGAKFLKISVACNKGAGEKQKTTWYNVVLFGHLVENMDGLVALFTPGRVIVAAGRPDPKAYLKNDGTLAMDNTIFASALPTLLDAKPKADK